MKIKILLGAAVATLFAISSCKKDDANNSGNSKKLKKVTRTENGETTVFNLTYDANGKLLSYRNTANTEYLLFGYDAAGNLTSIDDKEPGFKNIYRYTYQDNIPVSGTFKSWELTAGEPDDLVEDDQLTYTVSNNKVTRIKLEMMQTGAEAILALTYTGNNCTKIVSEGAIPYTADFGFGTHRSAFPKVSNYVLDQAGFSLQFASNNEIRSIDLDFPGTVLDQHIQTQYTYDANGYVLTSNDGTTQMVFEYQ